MNLSSKFLTLLLPLLLLTACIGAGPLSDVEGNDAPGTRFPTVVGTNLFGDEIALPEGFRGERNLVAVAYVREHQEDVNTWIAVADEMMETHENLRFYEVPVIYEGSAFFRFWLNNGMRSGIPDPVARERTVTVYLDRDAFNERLDVPDMDSIHILLTDSAGRILWRTVGPIGLGAEGDAKIAEIEALL